MRKRNSFSLLACALLILSSSCFVLNAKAETQTLNPIEDSYVEDVNPSANYGGKSYLQVSDSGNMFTGECLAFLKFDLSAIPAGVSVDSAELELYTTLCNRNTPNFSTLFFRQHMDRIGSHLH